MLRWCKELRSYDHVCAIIHGHGYLRSFPYLARMKVGSLLPLIGASAESIQRNRFCLMMSKGKVGTAHAANQDGNRRPQHESEEANEIHDDVFEVVHDTLVCLGEEVGESGRVEEIDFGMMHEDIGFAGLVAVHNEVEIV